jgi:curved DNA-binding protein CbpA
MKFINYYSILEVPFNATEVDLKKAYRTLSMKFHPDRNKDNISATLKQQEINEAYYILGNTEKKKVYDKEFLRYQEFLRNSSRQKQEKDTKTTEQNSENKERQRTDDKTYRNERSYEEFEVFDERLKDWMTEAKKQATQVAKQAASDLTGVLKEGAFAALGGLFTVIIWGIVINVIYFIFKSCQ